jgi:hypothetical protein
VTDLATRYGTERPTRRRLLVAGASVLGLVFLGWVAWAALFHGRPLASSELVGFEIVDQHTATATVTVDRRTTDVEASCLLRAQAADHSVVGELSFEVGPAQPETATLTRTVRTEREATAVEVVGCIADGQPQRR